ncbi:MAG: hypothetical protein NC453_29095 [Muribaculum sp.]|nr:hypothetical protein [Muribaculum sp.]
MSNQVNPIGSITQKEIEAMLRNAEADKRPPIRNFKNSVMSVMELPPIDLSTLPAWTTPIVPMSTINYGIDITPKPKKQRALTAEECQEMFGVSQSVKMNFIPQMLNSIMLQQATQLVNYCRENRVSELKKHTRVIKMAVEEYSQRLADAYGPMAFRAYVNYVNRFQSERAGDIWLMEMEADTICRNQLPKVKHREIAVRTLIIVMLIAFIQNYDKEMYKLIASKIGQPVHQKPDAYQEMIRAMCISIGDDFGYKINPNKTMGDWIKILSNKAWELADKIIGEEATS